MVKYQTTIKIPFETNEHAIIAKKTLSIDEELQPNKIQKEYFIENNNLIV